MSRKLTPASTLENLKREAKRWLKALRAGDAVARRRLERTTPAAPADLTLRDVQLALAREHGFPGWTALKREVLRIEAARAGEARQGAIEELFTAAIRGDVARVTEVLDAWPELVNERAEIPGHYGARTALHHGSAHEAVVRTLLERGADPNVRDEGDDAMPLHFAAERGDLDVVRSLIEHGADPVGDGTFHELNVLGWAVCWDYVHNFDVAEYLLAHGARHTIHTAVALGDVQVIREIAARSPAELHRPMDETNHRRRPLHLAVVKKQLAALTTLLALGADPEAVDAAALTPLDSAALRGESDSVRVLLDHGAQLRLPAAVALDRTGDLDRLLRDDADALRPGHRYGALIVRASERASGEIVERLIRAGASIDARDDASTAVDQSQGYTALHAAAFNGNVDAIAVLLRHGADPNVRERKYCATAAGWAAYAGHEAACRMILEAGIDPFQAIDFDLADRIPAIVRQAPWMLNQPFRAYAPWEPPAEQGDPAPWHTPLVWAVLCDKHDAVRALLEEGAAMIDAPDGRTLPQLAADAGLGRMVSLLEQHLVDEVGRE